MAGSTLKKPIRGRKMGVGAVLNISTNSATNLLKNNYDLTTLKSINSSTPYLTK
jgi:hypothetical protein